MRKDLEIVSAEIIDDNFKISFTKLCEYCHSEETFVHTLIEFGLIEPLDKREAELHFDATALQRTQKALRLQRDLAINMEGIALVLDLLDEVTELRQQLELLKKD
ncbi:MAG: chaperone modulator CbpM [Pseudomonadota bacterium]